MSELKTIPESELVSAYIAGDENALVMLINRHEHKIFGFICSKVMDKSIAEDIFQETFIKVIRTLKRGKYNEEGKFLPWIMRIAHNLVIDHFRKNKRMPKFDSKGDFEIFDLISDDSLDAENKLIKDQIEGDLHELIKVLPKDQLEVLQMRIFKEMSFKEIALKTDVSINTALGRMRYALINLRKEIDDKNMTLVN
ncbi:MULTISPECIES: RNA polymerase sigma factor [Psychroflexus]|uniref:RNA polymerase sigma-70 factor, ECF subfamily n=1 Tax=Psychroflexus halocasei TaxID=908615 RepID=A0A1H3ZBT9_9FLAO|nr:MULTISPECIES: sigma-70 family RNA polymerase sigma factor [Psychroflexus]PJX23664.1 RNA polymerase subunit sigma-24 [Psychroflexus sp. S27]SEA21137.1 RNA polymerase sigma-70 factor, ECF subfamily [Psychroflexus halocasei]